MNNNFYMLFVEGKSSPTKKHANYLIAMNEAERLATLKENIGKKVYLLEAKDEVFVDISNLPLRKKALV